MPIEAAETMANVFKLLPRLVLFRLIITLLVSGSLEEEKTYLSLRDHLVSFKERAHFSLF